MEFYYGDIHIYIFTKFLTSNVLILNWFSLVFVHGGYSKSCSSRTEKRILIQRVYGFLPFLLELCELLAILYRRPAPMRINPRIHLSISTTEK